MSERYCPKCDTVFYNGQRLCPDCGTEMQNRNSEEMYCPDCKNMFYNGQRNCPDCGAVMNKPSAVEKAAFEKKMQSSMEDETKYEQKNGKIEVWHIIAAAAVMISGVLVAASGVTAGFIIIVIDLLCALHILFPAIMVKRALKGAVRSNPTVANVVRIGAIAVAAFVTVIFLIQ